VSWRALFGLGAAVLAVSFGAPLARMTDAAPLAVAMWRMCLSVAFLLPLVTLRGGWSVPPRHRPAAILAGILLGLHFGLWIPSLWLTSVSASVVLVTTSPCGCCCCRRGSWGRRSAVEPGEFRVGADRCRDHRGGDLTLSPKALLGDGMALAAAGCMAGYLVVGKKLRSELSLASYLAVVYGGAAVVLIGAVAVLRVAPWPASRGAWLPLIGLAVGPTLTGHSLLNWALAHTQAYRVNLTVLLEPVLASFWTWLFVGEAPPLHVVPGAALVISALALECLPAAKRS